MIEIVAAGPLTTVQDLGRPGRQSQGIGHSGAADRPSLRLANRLVGNPESAAGLEATLGGLVVRFSGARTVAVTGASCPLRLDDRGVDMNSPLHVLAGQTLHIGPAVRRLRTYVAVSGGVAVPEVAGSRSTDLLSGLGPEPLRSGDRLPLGRGAGAVTAVDHAPQPLPDEHPVLRVTPGPRDDWFTAEALADLFGSEYEMTIDSNRVALRLSGPPLRRATDRELPSEPLVCGAIQVPPDGQPVLFLADHPVTGGYPVIGVVVDEDIPLAAQCRPGQRLRFRRNTVLVARQRFGTASRFTAPAAARRDTPRSRPGPPSRTASRAGVACRPPAPSPATRCASRARCRAARTAGRMRAAAAASR